MHTQSFREINSQCLMEALIQKMLPNLFNHFLNHAFSFQLIYNSEVSK